MDIGGATLAGAAMRAGLIDEYTLVTYPVLVGGGTPFFTALDSWKEDCHVSEPVLCLSTREEFPRVLMARQVWRNSSRSIST